MAAKHTVCPDLFVQHAGPVGTLEMRGDRADARPLVVASSSTSKLVDGGTATTSYHEAQPAAPEAFMMVRPSRIEFSGI
jgi:hypothetical protein